jgi:hypothetical protein
MGFFAVTSCLRNCIHNNGVYRNATEPERTISYNGQTYVFRHGFPPNCFTPEFLLAIMDTTQEVLKVINLQPEVIRLRAVEDLNDRIGQHDTIE